MEKNVKTEIELSEEHLQAITGGCAQCLADLAAAARLQNSAKGMMNGADVAIQLGQIKGRGGALQLHNMAQTLLGQAGNLLEQVRTRHPEINHPPQ